jgi:hypothetical protein
VETLTFASTAKFMRWAQRIAKYKYQNYDRVPVGNQTWTYGNGHIAQTEWGERGAQWSVTSATWSVSPTAVLISSGTSVLSTISTLEGE